jgi:hypothetical protein
MATTHANGYSLTDTFHNDVTESTVVKNSGINSAIIPAVLAGLLVTPLPNIPTNSTPSYTINTRVAKTGQQNEISFGRSNADIVNSYKNYPLNWDGYDGIAPSSETINNTLTFLEKLPYGVIEPRPGVSGDGEISLFWENDDIYIDIGFTGDGTYVLYARDNEGIEYFKDSIDLNSPLPTALLNLIYIN